MLIRTPEGVRAFLSDFSKAHRRSRNETPKIGLVPTMGALHPGHLSLIRQAREDMDCVVVSIFVNPLQFAPGEDFEQYPRTLEADLKLCRNAGVDAVFAPVPDAIYPSGESTLIQPPRKMMSGLCGKSRPGHFEGVATIVVKLLNIVQPTRAYFGQKDAQQLAIIKCLVRDLNLPVEIQPCPIVRENDGLAMSSRNQYLSDSERVLATQLYRSLRLAHQALREGTNSASELIQITQAHLQNYGDIQVGYVEIVHPDSLEPLARVKERALMAIAAKIGTTRLIDNMILDARKPILAIDGPAGAGKSTVTRRCAEQLGLLYLDTGAMYRAVTWWVLQSGVALDDEAAIADLLSNFELEMNPDSDVGLQVTVNGQNVTQAIRSQDVTAAVSGIAAQKAVRQALLIQQRRFGQKGGVVAEGRDIGTNVFPDAGVKIFLTASIEERARRRFLELEAQGNGDVAYEDLVKQIAERDRKDSQRAIAPLKQASDAIKIVTDGLTIDQVCEQIIDLFNKAAS